MSNLAQLKERLQRLKSKGGSSAIWKPKEGKDANRIRIVPLASQPGNPFIELQFHYLLGKTYLSPRSYGESDPIADFADETIRQGGLTKDEYKTIVKLRPQLRTFALILDRNDPEKELKFWGFGKQTYTKLLEMFDDPEYGDIADPAVGRDLKITYISAEKSPTKFAQTDVLCSPRQTSLASSEEELTKMMEKQPDILSAYERSTEEQLKAVLDQVINGQPKPEKPQVEVSDGWDDPTPNETVVSARVASGAPRFDTVADDFERLFADDSPSSDIED